MTEVTNRQWRALAQALPFFSPAPAVPPFNSMGEGNAPQPHVPDRRDFVENVLSRAASAFPEEVRAYQEAHRDQIASSPNALLDAAEALLTYAFGRSVLCPSQTLPPPLPMPSCSFSPLTAREVQLLRLYHRKQEQYAELFDAQQRLRGTMLTAVRSLQAAVQSVTEREGEGMSLVDSTRESLQWLGASQGLAAAALQPLSTSAPQTGFTSALASLPYTAFNAATPAAGVGHTATLGASSEAASPALMIVHRCVGCGEVGGDLLVCTQCGEVRHEACGGPHPPERSRVDGSLPSINVCRRCAKELNLSSSSSSLRSSTSSSERAELDEYFDSEDDSDSSLSGFVVHSSDVEEEEEEGENSEESSRGARSEDESANTKNSRFGGEGKRYRHRRRIHSGSESSDAEEGEVKEEVLARRRGKRPRKEGKRTTAAPMKHQKSQPRRRRACSNSNSSSSSSSSEDEASSASPATPPAKRHPAHTAPKSKATSSHPTPSLASSASPSAARRTQAAESPSKHRKEGKKGRQESSPPSTQDRRRMLDEEDELAMLGIRPTPETRGNGKQKKAAAAPSHSGLSSPQPSQRATTSSKQQSGGRRSVVNVASSSSSSDRDED